MSNYTLAQIEEANKNIVNKLVDAHSAIDELVEKIDRLLAIATNINNLAEADPELEKHINTSTLSASSQLLTSMEWMTGMIANVKSEINEAEDGLKFSNSAKLIS